MNFLKEKFKSYEEGLEDFLEWKTGWLEPADRADEKYYQECLKRWEKDFERYWNMENLEAIHPQIC